MTNKLFLGLLKYNKSHLVVVEQTTASVDELHRSHGLWADKASTFICCDCILDVF